MRRSFGTALVQFLRRMLPARLTSRYRPELHYMRGPGPKTLRMIGRRLRAETQSITQEPLPERWLALIHSLEHHEAKQTETQPRRTKERCVVQKNHGGEAGP